jgi:hypothetical protein
MINKSSVRVRVSREHFHFVIAGLDPAIHADAPLARIDRTERSPHLGMDHRVKPGGDEQRE